MELKYERAKVVQLNMELEKKNTSKPESRESIKKSSKRTTKKIAPNWRPQNSNHLFNVNLLSLFDIRYLILIIFK